MQLKRPVEAVARTLPVRLLRNLVAWVLHRYPLSTGYSTLVHSLPLRFLAMGEQFSLSYLRNGDRLVVFTKEHVGRHVLYLGDMDPRISFVLRRALRPGDRVVDVGANVGVITLQAARLVGAQGDVHAFEPNPRLATLLRASLVLNGITHVTLHECALSDHDGTAVLAVPPSNLGHGHIGTPVAGEDSYEIDVRDARAVIEEIGLAGVKLIKLDVEGHEGPLLRSMSPLLAQTPVPVLFESKDDPRPFTDREPVQELTTLGYRIYALRATWREVFLEVAAGQADATDYLAVHDDYLRDDDGSVSALVRGARAGSPLRASARQLMRP